MVLLFFPRTPCVRSYTWPTSTYCYPMVVTSCNAFKCDISCHKSPVWKTSRVYLRADQYLQYHRALFGYNARSLYDLSSTRIVYKHMSRMKTLFCMHPISQNYTLAGIASRSANAGYRRSHTNATLVHRTDFQG